MLKQHQTILSDKDKGIRGNCLITSYACYFDKPVNDCPQFQYLFDCTVPYSDFYNDVVNLWVDKMGYKIENYPVDPNSWGFEDYYFAWGMSPRGVYHQVIYKDGGLYHDPHPSGLGLNTVEGYQILIKK